MIGGVIKYFRFTYDYILWEISYANINMLLAAIPEYETEEEKSKPQTKKIDSMADLEKLFND